MAIQKFEHPLIHYGNKTRKSYEVMKEAENYLPGGVTANIKHFPPYPIVMEKANGALVEDVDGNQYIDYLMAYGSLALGHGASEIKSAMIEQIDQEGTNLFGTPHKMEITFAKKIMEHYPSMEKVRFTNSGTEATLLAVRLATAYTGKNRIAKFEGHYHGGYNDVLYSINPPLNEAGTEEEPNAVPESAGLDMTGLKPLILPFNQAEAAEKLIREHADELAAIIIEPVQGGFIPAEQSFMTKLREVTNELGIIFIFDEVKTGYRVALGGAQAIYQVNPDMTTLGKVIGGGFPVGLVGGKEEILNISCPKASGDVFNASESKTSTAKEILFHSGTYNGHPTILAAGLATIQRLEKDFANVVSNTNILKANIEDIGKKAGVPLKAIGVGSIFSVVCTTEANILHYRDLQKTDLSLRKEIDFHLISEGIYTKPMNRYSVSTAHGEEELKKTIQAYEKVLFDRLRGSSI
ncbi:aspartate aminotransferase family protein [Evansella halocellulosilytica]|uniref:aspartate aminotransferase family protein n=1 Tax=Evansella halocellulosilytica TaxID=2011013 RepID=UPI000BB72BF4|nr:aspartate aminotransferase family protein [Evansella halocellulosilytica]